MPNAVPIPIVVFAGQSNANNTGSIGAVFNGVAAHGGLMVHAAVNGSRLASGAGDDWSVTDGELLHELFVQLDGILNPNSPTYIAGAFLDSVIWSQGGSDIFSVSNANAYQANLTAMIAVLTAKYGSHDFIISAMADASYDGRNLTGQTALNWQTVHAAQIAVAELPNVFLLDPDRVAQNAGFSASQMFNSDYIHYDTASGYGKTLGKALVNMAFSGDITPRSSAISYKSGTTGSDTFSAGSTGMTQIWGNQGTDTLTFTPTVAGILLLDQGMNTTRIIGRDAGSTLFIDAVSIEKVTLSNGNDQARLAGNVTQVNTMGGKDKVMGSDAAERAYLGDGADYSALLRGNDTIYGQGGSDTMLGGAGNDHLYGGAANDKMNGGIGNDRLSGGTGPDRFIFDPHGGTDTLTDFQNGTDKLIFSHARWSDVSIRMQDGNAVIRVLDTTVILMDTPKTQLDISDFIFI